MSIQTAIQDLRSKVSAAWAAVEEKGGAMPSQQNLENLASGIAGIPTDDGISEDEYITHTPSVFNMPEITNSTVSFVGEGAFVNNNSIQNATFTNAKTVKVNAFKDCLNLSYISFPSATSFESSAFANCGFTSLEINPSTIKLGDSCFYGCSKLTSITFTERCQGPSSIGSYIFGNCPSLKTVQCLTTTNIGRYMFYSCYQLSSFDFTKIITLPEGAFYHTGFTSISLSKLAASASHAFESCSRLSYADLSEIPGTTFSIPSYLFQWCSTLTTVALPEYVTAINTAAFYNCQRLTTLSNTPSRMSKICESAFFNCYSLSQIGFSECTEIGSYAFTAANRLNTISFPQCTIIYDRAFSGCSKLQNIVFPKCAIIKDYAFFKCVSLTSVDFPICQIIHSYAFSNCTNLINANFPNVTTIYNNAFAACTRLNLTLNYSSVVEITSTTFSNCGSSFTVNVPASLYNAYCQDSMWASISSRIFPIS